MVLSLFRRFSDCTAMRHFIKWKCRVVACLQFTMLDGCIEAIEREKGKEKWARRQERKGEEIYTCHTQKSHMERNAISACVDVPLNVACSHAFRSWYANKRRQHQQQKFIYQDRCTQKKARQKTSVFIYYFFPNRRVKKRDARTSNQFRWHWVWVRCKECIRKNKRWKKKLCPESERKREKVPFPMAKTRNYVYYAIRRAHFAFLQRKDELLSKETRISYNYKTIDICLYLWIKCSFCRSFGHSFTLHLST